MAKVIAAADHQKYVKAVVTYLAEMKALPQTAPEVERISTRKFHSEEGMWKF